MGRQAHQLMLVLSIIAFTDTYPSITNGEEASRSPNALHSTESSFRDEIIYATNLALKHKDDQKSSEQELASDQSGSSEEYTSFQTLYDKNNDIIPTLQAYPESYTISLDTPFPQNPFNDEILEKASRLSNANYDNIKLALDSTTDSNNNYNRKRIADDNDKLRSEVSEFNENGKKIENTGEVVDDELLQMEVSGSDEERDRLERLANGGSLGQNSFNSEVMGMIDDKTSVTSQGPVLVWGEVGRGIVAATLDYGKGEVGRRPLVLAGSKGRARSGPYFEEDSPPSNITAPAGSTVFMDCRVAMLQDKVVTWAARRDDRLQLLTVAKQAYIADKRFSLSFRYPNNWRLRILTVQKQDQGLYECQVAAHPPIIKQIYLAVISPEVSIWDESNRSVVERYYKSGSSLQLTCSAWQLLQPPELLSWWKDNQHLTEGISCNVTGSDSATCTLVVDQVSRSHAGTYTCGAFPWVLDGSGGGGEWSAGSPPTTASYSQSQDAAYILPQAEGYANASVAVHVLHGNLIGVAVLPNTGKSVGSSRVNLISLHNIILGLSTYFFIHIR